MKSCYWSDLQFCSSMQDKATDAAHAQPDASDVAGSRSTDAQAAADEVPPNKRVSPCLLH